MKLFIQFAGVLQLFVAGSSFFIAHELRWKEQTSKMNKLTERVFWTYSKYILGINLIMASLCLFGTELLMDKTPLATLVSGFIGAYWIARLLVQLFCYRRLRPEGRFYAIGDWSLIAVFFAISFILFLNTVH